MSAGEWFIVAAVVFSVVLSAAQGFFLEIFSLAGVVLGFLLASWEYSVVASRLTFINPPWAANIVAFFLVFVAIAILAGAIGRIVSWGMKQVGLRWMDRVLGGAFGLVRGLLVVTVAVMATAAFMPDSQVLARSQMAPYFLVAGRAASWLAPSEVRSKVREGIEVLHAGKRKAAEVKPAGSSTESEQKSSASTGK
jgi:membrane protein required for colicin V production